MDKWISLGESVPSALNSDECDVALLDAEDLKDDLPEDQELIQSVSQFPYLVSLTMILDDLYRNFFTVRATSTMAADLELSLETARRLRQELKQWHDSLPASLKGQRRTVTGPTQAEMLWDLDARGSFRLAYLTVQLTLFRALLRPVSRMVSLPTSPAHTSTSDVEELNRPKAVIKGAMAIVEEVLHFVEGLSGSEWDAFWHSCESSAP